MSESNVELHRRLKQAFIARNEVEAFVAFCHPRIELKSSVTGFHSGHGGVLRWRRDLTDAFGEETWVEPKAYFELEEHTLSFHVLHTRGKESGAEVGIPAAHLCRWRDGLVVYFKGYRGVDCRREVARDLGISEADLKPIAP